MRIPRKLVIALTTLASLVILGFAAALILTTMSSAREQRERDRLTQALNTPHEWPAFTSPSQGVRATLQTVCSTSNFGVSGTFRYQLRIEPADSVWALYSSPTVIGRPSDPDPSQAPGTAAGRSGSAVDEPSRAREDSFSQMLSSMAEALVVRTAPTLVLEFADTNGFQLHHVTVPSSVLTTEFSEETAAAVLVANHQDSVPCGPNVLQFATWKVRFGP